VAQGPGPIRERGLEAEPTEPPPRPPRRHRLVALVVALSALAIVWGILAPPRAPLDKADRVGYAICHQLPERSFFMAGRQLPLCARCTGTFLGAMLGLAAMLLRRRGRASRMPPAAVLGVLIGCMGLWALDGLNSYLTFFPGAPHLYEPQNWLRLTTGSLNGLAMVAFLFPVFSFTIWREPAPERAIKNLGEWVALLPAVAMLVVVVQAQIGLLLYPVALLSSLGVLVLLVLINSMIAAVVLGREAYAQTWRQALVPLSVGLALAVLQLAGLGLLRDVVTAQFALPF
jgi:uncharacterized membrane protein